MKKTSIKSIYPDLWPPTSSQLQGLTVKKNVCVPDDVQKCLWIQVVTGEVWLTYRLKTTFSKLAVLLVSQYWARKAEFRIKKW